MAIDLVNHGTGEADTGNETEIDRLRTDLAAAREEAKAARGETQALKDEKNLAIAHAKMRKIWREKGLIDDIQAQRTLAKLLIGVDEDGNHIVRDFDGKERIGVTVEQMVDDLVVSLPSLKGSGGSGGSSAPAAPTPNGSPRGAAKDDLKTTRQKMDYITKFGLPAWEALPTARPRSTVGDPETAVLRWSNDQKGEYLRTHTHLELSELFRKAREKERTRH